MLGTKYFAAAIMILTGMLLFSCATEQKFVSVSDPEKAFKLGKLSFLAPPGNRWVYKSFSKPAAKSIFFLRGRDLPPRSVVSVWEFTRDNPKTSSDDLRAYFVTVINGFDVEGRYEILKSKCEVDETWAKVGILCYTESRVYRTGMDPIDLSGHVYVFVHPDDDRRIGAIEYLQEFRRGGQPADTKKLLGEFGQNVTFLK